MLKEQKVELICLQIKKMKVSNKRSSDIQKRKEKFSVEVILCDTLKEEGHSHPVKQVLYLLLMENVVIDNWTKTQHV